MVCVSVSVLFSVMNVFVCLNVFYIWEGWWVCKSVKACCEYKLVRLYLNKKINDNLILAKCFYLRRLLAFLIALDAGFGRCCMFAAFELNENKSKLKFWLINDADMIVTYDWNWNMPVGCCCMSGCCCWGSSNDVGNDKLLLPSTAEFGNDWKLRFDAGSCDPNLNNPDDVVVLNEGITGLLLEETPAPPKLNGLLGAPKLKPTDAGLSIDGCGSLFGLAPNVNRELVPIGPLLLLVVFVPMKLKLDGNELEPKTGAVGVGFAESVMFGELPKVNKVFEVDDWPTLPAVVVDDVAVPGWAKLIVILGIGGPESIFGTVIGDPKFSSLPNRVPLVDFVVVVEVDIFVVDVTAPPNVNEELVEVSIITIWWG